MSADPGGPAAVRIVTPREVSGLWSVASADTSAEEAVTLLDHVGRPEDVTYRCRRGCILCKVWWEPESHRALMWRAGSKWKTGNLPDESTTTRWIVAPTAGWISDQSDLDAFIVGQCRHRAYAIRGEPLSLVIEHARDAFTSARRANYVMEDTFTAWVRTLD